MAVTGMNPILDPRGLQPRPEFQLAPRVTVAELKKGPILFFDNAKLGFGNYMQVFTRIKDRFGKNGIQNYIDVRQTVRGKTSRDLEELAEKLAEHKPAAAILALGDMGVSPATAIVAIAMEKLGIPTVYITAPPGTDLARAVAHYRAGELCICSIDLFQGSTMEEISMMVDEQMPGIYDALTLAPERIGRRAFLDCGLDSIAPREDGFLETTDRIDTDKIDFSEPAAGIEEINDQFNELHIGDGLPVIPPTRGRLKKMMSCCPFDPDLPLARGIGPSGKDITVKDIAMAAVMAGCKPGVMPVLVAAFKAMGGKNYNFLQSVTTSHPGGNLVLVSGPLAQEIGFYGRAGCLGPGFPVNLTTGRAVNLVLINVCRAVPGHADLACLSSQAEITYCFCEDPDLTPWQTINAERYNDETSTVLVLKAEAPHNIIDFLSNTAGDLMDSIIDCCTSLGSNNAYIPGPLVLVLTPDHARILDREGWDKEKIRSRIHEGAVHPVAMLRNRGLKPVRPDSFADKHPMPVTRGPKDVEIVVAGGRGGHSSIILPWALYSDAVVEPITLPSGQVAKSIEDFMIG